MKGSARSRWYRVMSGTVAILVAAAILAMEPPRARAACTGDCNSDDNVTIDEILMTVNIALGNANVMDCSAGDANGDGQITIDEILTTVNNALTECPSGPPVCGNHVIDSGEDCDNGGICIGGDNAGTLCTADSQCQGDGVCVDGPKAEFVCSSDADCPSGTCVRCKPFGGNGCAANCTTESVVDITLVPGQSPDNVSITPGTSGLVVNSPTLSVGIPYSANTTRQLLVGSEKDGKIPAVLKAETNMTAAIEVLGGSACICLRPVVLKTCGGTMWEKDGMPSTNCTPDYTDGDSVCAGGKPCTLVYGSDNIGAGDIGCNGIDGINMTSTQDSGGSSGTPGPVMTTLSDAGGPGSAVVFLSTELGFVVAPCTGTTPDYGPDGEFCTDDDPKMERLVLPRVMTTGTASASVLNADQTDDNTLGPFGVQGSLLSCSAVASGSASGGALAGGFSQLGAPVVGDIVVTDVQVVQ
jgi:hypothetical protein